ncbi:MAG: radical SAM protein [bacterium]
MKVLLINPNLVNPFKPFFIEDEEKFLNETFPSLGINLLASILKDAGHEAIVYDHLLEYLKSGSGALDILKGAEKIFSKNCFDFVGITTISNTRKASFDLARLAKKYGNVVVLGGPHSIMYEQILRLYDFVDYVAVGEGEKTILNLVNFLAGKAKDLKGIAFRKNGKINLEPQEIANLDNYPPPDYSTYFNFSRKPKKISMVSERGCHGCAYCQNYWGRTMRSKSAKNVISEVRGNVEKYGIRKITFQDDNFIFDKPRAIKILNGIRSLKLEIDLIGRADFIDKELAKVMKSAGVKSIFIGVETGDEKIRMEKMGKNLTDEHIRKAVKALKDEGIFVCGYVMLGYPDETDNDIRRTFYFLKELQLDRINCSITHINAFSPLYRQILSRGLIAGIKEWSDENRSRVYLHSRKRLLILLAIRKIFLQHFCKIGRAHEHYTALEYDDDYTFTEEEILLARAEAKKILGC